jgi:transcriptional regulator with XRE-family HTH domain
MQHITMLAREVRERRRARGLTQAALASRSGVGRVTIARLETGKAEECRVGTLVRLCDVLGLELAAVAPGSVPAQEARLARERERVRRIDARRRHAELAARLLAQPARTSAAFVRRAQANVDRWERDRLCSEHYVSRWRRKLSGPIPRVARALIEHDEWTDALFQNTPWTFALPSAAA